MIGEVTVHDDVVRRAFEKAPQVMLRHMDQAVGKAGLVMARAVRQELRNNSSMGDSTLLNSIRPDRPMPGVREVRAGVKYARFVEEGAKPGRMPPLQPLMAWIKAKDGTVDNLRQRAFGLARHIRAYGTKPHPFFKPAFKKTQSQLLQILRDGAASGVREALGVSNHYAMTGSRG